MSRLHSAASSSGLLLALWLVAPGGAESQVPKYEAIEVVDGGAIVGLVTWTGDLPELQHLPITKNPEVCDLSGAGVRPSPRLIVSEENRGVGNTVVYLADIGKGKALDALLTAELLKAELEPGQNLRIDQAQCIYEPHITLAPLRAELDMTSSDDLLHNLHMSGSARYNLAFPIKDKVITRRLRKAGLISIACDAGHSWMSAYIHVVHHPYYAITDDEGGFTLSDVPAGKYSLHAWHEGWDIVKTEAQGGQITGYEFSEPNILEDEVTVAAGTETQANFELSNASEPESQ